MFPRLFLFLGLACAGLAQASTPTPAPPSGSIFSQVDEMLPTRWEELRPFDRGLLAFLL
jgi:hypothetical protein